MNIEEKIDFHINEGKHNIHDIGSDELDDEVKKRFKKMKGVKEKDKPKEKTNEDDNMNIEEKIDLYLSEASTSQLAYQHTEFSGFRKMSGQQFDTAAKDLIKRAFDMYSKGGFEFKKYSHIKDVTDVDLKKLTSKHFGIIDKKTGDTIGYVHDSGRRFEIRSNYMQWRNRMSEL